MSVGAEKQHIFIPFTSAIIRSHLPNGGAALLRRQNPAKQQLCPTLFFLCRMDMLFRPMCLK
jgi:hypothetical protein